MQRSEGCITIYAVQLSCTVYKVHTEALDIQLYNFSNKHYKGVSLVSAATLPDSY